MDKQAQPLHQNRFLLLLARPWASRLIAALGIVLMIVGFSVPIAGRDVIFHSDLVSLSHYSETWAIRNSITALLEPLHVGRLPLLLQLGLDALYSALTLGGLALIPLLWWPLSRKGSVVLRRTYATWLLLLTILAVAGLPAWWRFMSQPPVGPSSQTITLGALYLLPGVIVFPLGMLVSCAALFLIFREPLPASASAPRTGWGWVAALTLTMGVLIWGVGFYLMPEAITADCPPIIFSVTQFAHGACAGLDSDQVLQAAYYAGLNPIAFFLYTVGRNFELLVALGCLTALGGWTRHLSVRTLAWLVVWPILALGVALVAHQGAGEIARRGFQLTAATGTSWRVAPGMIVTYVGIALVLLGQLGLWRELMWCKGTSSAR